MPNSRAIHCHGIKVNRFSQFSGLSRHAFGLVLLAAPGGITRPKSEKGRPKERPLVVTTNLVGLFLDASGNRVLGAFIEAGEDRIIDPTRDRFERLAEFQRERSPVDIDIDVVDFHQGNLLPLAGVENDTTAGHEE